MQYSENAKLVKLIVGNQDDASAKQKKAIGEATAPTQDTPEITFDKSPQTLGQVFAESVRGGQAQLTTDYETFKGLGNIVLGNTEAAENNLAIAKSYEDYSSEIFNSIQPFEEFLEEPTFGGFFTQVTKALGQFTPMAVSSLASGFAGAAAGLLGKTTLRASSKFAVKKIYEDTVQKQATKGLAALTPSERAIFNEGYGYMKYAKRGGIAGAFGQEYLIGSSQSASEFQEAGRELTPLEAYQSLALGVPQAVLGTASEVLFANVLLKATFAGTPLAKLERKARTKGVAALNANEQKAYKIVEKINKREKLKASEANAIKKYIGPERNVFANLAIDIGKGFGGSGAVEGITEVAQEGLGVAQRFSIDDEYTARDAKLRLAEAAFAGFFAGGARGGAGGAATAIINQARAYTEQGNVLEAEVNNQRQTKGEGETFNRKSSEELNAEIALGKQAIYAPGINDINEISSEVDLGKIKDLDSIPHKGGLIIGTKKALTPVRNQKKALDASTNPTADNFANINNAVEQLFDGEEITNTPEVDTEIVVKNAAGTVVAR